MVNFIITTSVNFVKLVILVDHVAIVGFSTRVDPVEFVDLVDLVEHADLADLVEVIYVDYVDYVDIVDIVDRVCLVRIFVGPRQPY